MCSSDLHGHPRQGDQSGTGAPRFPLQRGHDAADHALVACGAGALRMGRTDAIRVGVGMVPRGEVGMVVAQIGLNLGVIGSSIYGTIVFLSVATTLIAPPLLKLAFASPTEMEREIVRLG